MSFAIHLFMADRFSEEPYRRFLDKTQKLYGKWNLVESFPLNGGPGLHIHEYWIQSESLPPDENFRVHVRVERMSPDIPWGFDYEWGLHFETGAGRSATGLAVQLGALFLAMEGFEWFCVVDHDTCVPDQPAEFRTRKAVCEHIKRVIETEFSEYFEDLKRRGLVSDDGYLLLPSR